MGFTERCPSVSRKSLVSPWATGNCQRHTWCTTRVTRTLLRTSATMPAFCCAFNTLVRSKTWNQRVQWQLSYPQNWLIHGLNWMAGECTLILSNISACRLLSDLVTPLEELPCGLPTALGPVCAELMRSEERAGLIQLWPQM